MNEEQDEIIALLKEGGELIRDFIQGTTTFRVISGTKVKTFPLDVFHKMKKHGIVELKKVEAMHSVYKLVPKKKE